MIEIQHLKKQFDESTPLEDVNATIYKGDVIAVIGPSGTGKSTLLRCINLLETPTSGRILFDGEDITDPKCDIDHIRQKIGMVFQSFNLYDHLTVVENCMLAQTVVLKRSRQEAYDIAMEHLKSVGMDSRARQYPYHLSGGQKQRVAIARALCTDPEILLFDEPTSALDPLSVSEVENVIADLSKQGRTMMIVTHEMGFARKVASRVFYMDQGGIYEEGSAAQIFDNPQKERTIKFIKRLSSLEMTVTEANHDLNEEIGKIFSFCSSKGLDGNRIKNACAAYEEYCGMLYRYAFGNDRTYYVSLDYDSAADKLFLSFAVNSTKDWNQIEKKILNSLEYKLFCHYVRDTIGQTTETNVGNGLKYTYEL